MPNTDRTLTLLETLCAAFPERAVPKQTLQIYLDYLADIPYWLLEVTVDHCIETCTFFPKVAELRLMAMKLAKVNTFVWLPEEPVDYLAIHAQELLDAFFSDHTLDPDAWRALAREFEAANRPARAAQTLTKLANLEELLEQINSSAVSPAQPHKSPPNTLSPVGPGLPPDGSMVTPKAS